MLGVLRRIFAFLNTPIDPWGFWHRAENGMELPTSPPPTGRDSPQQHVFAQDSRIFSLAGLFKARSAGGKKVMEEGPMEF